MKRTITITLLSCLATHLSFGMGINNIRVGLEPTIFLSDPFAGEVDSDETPDETTVRFTLNNDSANNRWSFRAEHHQTQSLDLRATYDLSLGDNLRINFQMFPKGNSQAVKKMVVHGMNLQDVTFNYIDNTIDLTVQPVDPALTASHNALDYHSGLGIDFYYSGEFEDPANFDYSVPIIVTDAFLDDVSQPAHPSSERLWGTAIRIDGIQGEPVQYQFLIGERFATHKGVTFEQMMGYLDGMVPATGFSMGEAALPGINVDMGVSEEPFRIFVGQNIQFSARDIQLGMLLPPLEIGSVSLEQDGLHITWDAVEGQTYAIESTENLDEAFIPEAQNQTGPEYVSPTTSLPQKFFRIVEE